MLALGHARMLEYQGPAYANLYLERLQQVLAGRTRRRPGGRPGFRHHARDGTLAGAVDGLRRHRAGRRPQEPRHSLAAGQGRGQGRRGRPAQGLRPLQARHSGVRRVAAPGPGRQAGALGPRAGAQGQAAVGPAAEGGHAQRLRHARAARAGRPQVAAGARQPLCHRTVDDRQMAGGRRPRHAQRIGSWATRSPCAAASSRAMARPTNAARRTCCMCWTIWRRGRRPKRAPRPSPRRAMRRWPTMPARTWTQHWWPTARRRGRSRSSRSASCASPNRLNSQTAA